MKIKTVKTFYRQNLPHILPIGATFFITFRLYGSIPWTRLKSLKLDFETKIRAIKISEALNRKQLTRDAQRQFFLKYDTLLDSILAGPKYLKEDSVAQIVQKELHRLDEQLYDLLAYCIMPNHVHLLLDTGIQIDVAEQPFSEIDFVPLYEIMKRIKGPTAVYANQILNRSGKFWQRESYDRFIRTNKELNNTVAYILNNPVKAGLVKVWEEWPYSYCKGFEGK